MSSTLQGPEISKKELRLRKLFREDFEFYAPRALKISPKEGMLVPFELNKAQRYLHLVAEKQKAEKGRVRIIVVKGRQQGVSTYVEGRFYWKTSQRQGVSAFILTHEDKATQNLFAMAQRYHDHCPEKLKPSTGSASAKRLDFAALESGYTVGTAGTIAVGRSSTNQYFHGSEVAYWPHADTHATGVMQTVPMADGTEVFLESTGNGLGNYFHAQAQLALRGDSDFILVFIPWYWQDEYKLECGDDFELTPEEYDLLLQFKDDGLTAEHLNWRRMKIREFTARPEVDEGAWKFKQEYPFTVDEAFQTSGDESLIDAKFVLKARKTEKAMSGAHIVGLDPARFGKDRSAFIHRNGRKAWGKEVYRKKSTMQIAGIAAKMLRDPATGMATDVDMMFIDVGGLGAGVYDRLAELGFEEEGRIMPVESGAAATEDNRYGNKRDEMWGRMKEWFEMPGGVDVPDDDEIQADVCAPLYDYDSNSRLIVEPVKSGKGQAITGGRARWGLRNRGIESPDVGTALALTFAEPVAPPDIRAKKAREQAAQATVNYGV